MLICHLLPQSKFLWSKNRRIIIHDHIAKEEPHMTKIRRKLIQQLPSGIQVEVVAMLLEHSIETMETRWWLDESEYKAYDITLFNRKNVDFKDRVSTIPVAASTTSFKNKALLLYARMNHLYGESCTRNSFVKRYLCRFLRCITAVLAVGQLSALHTATVFCCSTVLKMLHSIYNRFISACYCMIILDMASLSPDGTKLAIYVISTYFDELVSKVCECVLRKGTLSQAQVIRFMELSKQNVSNSLLVLIQHNCVQAFAIHQPGGFGEQEKIVSQYMALHDNIIHHMRFPKFYLFCQMNLVKIVQRLLKGYFNKVDYH